MDCIEEFTFQMNPMRNVAVTNNICYPVEKG